MTRSALLVFSLVLAFPFAAHAEKGKTIEGRVTGIGAAPDRDAAGDEAAESVVIRTDKDVEVTVLATSHTRYARWVTGPPWQQSTRAKASMLRVGSRVSVVVQESGADLVATRIRIATN